LKLEAELISAFGTEDTGGILTNSVVPSGLLSRTPNHLIVPADIREKAQLGLKFLKDAVLELAQAYVKGVSNSDVVKALGLRSDYGAGSKDYLAYSVLGILMREGRMKRETKSRKHIAQV
jgi:hypothetical protein